MAWPDAHANGGRRTKSRRKPGGQPGHPGHARPLVPAARVNTILDLVPDACRHCHHALRAAADAWADEPRRHQVTELPPIEAHITEYRCHRIACPACGKTTQASLPAEFDGQFGPQLTALIAYLTVVCRLPRLVVQRLLEGALQIPISLGSTQHAWEEASAAVAGPYEELQAALPIQPVLNADETGHRTNGAKRWLWTLVAPTFRVLHHRDLARLGRAAAPARRHVRRRARQRPLGDLYGVRVGPPPVPAGLTSRAISSARRSWRRPPRRNAFAGRPWPCSGACSACGIASAAIRTSAAVRSPASN